jgi:hypothetical protein
MELIVVERVASSEHMVTLVSVGLALGFVGALELALCQECGVVARPLADCTAVLITFRLDTKSA